MIEWISFLPLNLIFKHSSLHNVDANLITAIVSVESSGKINTVRYEPQYKWVYNVNEFAKKNNITIETELNLQKTSFGLMQIMGAVARELGHQGQLTKLNDPSINLEYGIKLVERLNNKYENIKDVISSYNQGSPRKQKNGDYINQTYVDKVYSRFLTIKSI